MEPGASATIEWVGDGALRCEFGALALEIGNRAARALRRALLAAALEEIDDLVPGATSLVVLLRPGVEPSARLLDLLAAPVAVGSEGASDALHEIAVRYGGETGPDLADLARELGIAERDVVARHAAAVYTVAFLGFSPGFAYLLGLPAELHAPRLATPRTRVPAGSVAIGGAFTGIYPRATPGGWRILGRTDAVMFDPSATPASRLAPGDRVRFVPR